MRPDHSLPGRQDTREVFPVDLLGSDERQLAFAVDGASGSSLGSTQLHVFRWNGRELVEIFEHELNFNMGNPDPAGKDVWLLSETALTAIAGPTRGAKEIVATTKMTVEKVSARYSCRWRWDGVKYSPDPGVKAREAAARRRVDAEWDRLTRGR